MKRLFAMAISIAAAPVAQAQHENHARHHDSMPSDDAQIIVTINPEARVSAALGASLPPPRACGTATAIKIKVINQGFVTAPLRANIVGDGARHVALHVDDTDLSGKREDARVLQLIPHGPSLVDVTIAFNIDNNIGDLGGRDRVHLLVRCGSSAS